MRLLVWLAFAALVYLALRSRARAMQESLRRAAREQANSQANAPAGGAGPFAQPQPHSAAAENMVACSYCQLYLPASEAINRSNDHFCCEEHAQLHAAGVPHSTAPHSSAPHSPSNPAE